MQNIPLESIQALTCSAGAWHGSRLKAVRDSKAPYATSQLCDYALSPRQGNLQLAASCRGPLDSGALCTDGLIQNERRCACFAA